MNETNPAGTRARLAALGAALALATAAGCGGSDDPGTTTQAATTSSTPMSSTTTSSTPTTTTRDDHGGAQPKPGGGGDRSTPEVTAGDQGSPTGDRGASQPQPNAAELAELRQKLIDALTNGDPIDHRARILKLRHQLEQLRMDSLSPEQQAQIKQQQQEQHQHEQQAEHGSEQRHGGAPPGANGGGG